jgi:predicted ester cyclase
VVCRWRATGTHDGELYGIPATGKAFEYTGVSVWEFDDGKARRGWAFPDNVTLMQQLGVA